MSQEQPELQLGNSRGSRSRGILSSLSPSSIGSRVAELIDIDDSEPDPRGHSRGRDTIRSTNADVSRPDRTKEACWQEYKENPIINTSIQAYVSEVFEAGWWITAENEEAKEQAVEFCKNIGIYGPQTHRPLQELGRQMLIQHEARGDFMAEKMLDDRDRHIGLNPVNPSTMEIYTKPGVNMLLPPDYVGDDNSNNVNSTASRRQSYQGDVYLRETPNGETAAYVQFDRTLSRWEERDERRFARGQILHWPRNPDIGDKFGNSTVEPVLARSRALREKLQDNDLAISMKAWPMVMFQLGDPDRPWSWSRIEDFMEDYDDRNLGPGMYQGVPGDVEVNEFAGETADISEHVMTDVDMIISSMPGPKHSLGAFSVGSGLTDAHDQQFKKTVREGRRDLENTLTPYIKEVLESWDYDASDLELNIGRPDGEVAPEDIQGSIIRYTSDAGDKNREAGIVEIPDDDEDDTSGNQSGDDQPLVSNEASTDDTTRIETLAGPGVYQYGRPFGTEELASSPPTETDAIVDDLGTAIGQVFVESMSVVRDEIGTDSSRSSLIAADMVTSSFESEVAHNANASDLSGAVRDACEDAVDAALATVEAEGYGGQYTSDHRELIEAEIEAIITETTTLGNEIASELGRHTESIGRSQRSEEAILERVDDVYGDDKMAYRGQLIAEMAIRRCVNKAKLHAYQATDVDSVGIQSRCLESTHDVTAELAGCNGDRVTASLGSDQPIGAQFQTQLSSDPPTGFAPLGDVPPFAYGSKAELIAVE